MNHRSDYYGSPSQGRSDPPGRFPSREWAGDNPRVGTPYRQDRSFSGDRDDQWQPNRGRYEGESGDYGDRGAQYGDRSYQRSAGYGQQYSQSGGYVDDDRVGRSYRDDEGRRGHYGYDDGRVEFGRDRGAGRFERGAGGPSDSGYRGHPSSGGYEEDAPTSYPPFGERPYGRRDRLAAGRGGFYARGEEDYGEGREGGRAGRGASGWDSSHRGRGPKGYQRSDDRLKEDICERLTEAPDIDPSEVSIQVSNGKVTITGEVDQRWTKHRVEDLIDACAGVKDIDNRLTVSRGGRSDQTASQDAESSSSSGRSAESSRSSSTSASNGNESNRKRQ